jgi:hypothetical protein
MTAAHVGYRRTGPGGEDGLGCVRRQHNLLVDEVRGRLDVTLVLVACPLELNRVGIEFNLCLDEFLGLMHMMSKIPLPPRQFLVLPLPPWLSHVAQSL